MNAILNRLTSKTDENPSAAEMRFRILRLERDEAYESKADGASLWAKAKSGPKRRHGFLATKKSAKRK